MTSAAAAAAGSARRRPEPRRPASAFSHRQRARFARLGPRLREQVRNWRLAAPLGEVEGRLAARGLRVHVGPLVDQELDVSGRKVRPSRPRASGRVRPAAIAGVHVGPGAIAFLISAGFAESAGAAARRDEEEAALRFIAFAVGRLEEQVHAPAGCSRSRRRQGEHAVSLRVRPAVEEQPDEGLVARARPPAAAASSGRGSVGPPRTGSPCDRAGV